MANAINALRTPAAGMALLLFLARTKNRKVISPRDDKHSFCTYVAHTAATPHPCMQYYARMHGGRGGVTIRVTISVTTRFTTVMPGPTDCCLHILTRTRTRPRLPSQRRSGVVARRQRSSISESSYPLASVSTVHHHIRVRDSASRRQSSDAGSAAAVGAGAALPADAAQALRRPAGPGRALLAPRAATGCRAVTAVTAVTR